MIIWPARNSECEIMMADPSVFFVQPEKIDRSPIILPLHLGQKSARPVNKLRVLEAEAGPMPALFFSA